MLHTHKRTPTNVLHQRSVPFYNLNLLHLVISWIVEESTHPATMAQYNHAFYQHSMTGGSTVAALSGGLQPELQFHIEGIEEEDVSQHTIAVKHVKVIEYLKSLHVRDPNLKVSHFTFPLMSHSPTLSLLGIRMIGRISRYSS